MCHHWNVGVLFLVFFVSFFTIMFSSEDFCKADFFNFLDLTYKFLYIL